MNQTEQAARIPELDGLRGLAIVMVMVYHLTLLAAPFARSAFLKSTLVQAASMGWAGVDLFFVLSGFLISSILLKTRRDPHYFKNFYARRVLRIFPLYYLFIAVMFIFLPFFSPKLDPGVARAGWPFFALYLHNWLYIPKFADHFFIIVPAYISPIWSLAIEEQFYFLWPSVVYFLNRRKLFVFSIVVVVIALLIRVSLVLFSSNWASLEYFLYYSSFTRFDGLCMGALIALAFETERGGAVLARWAWPVLIGVVAGMIGIVLVNSNVFALSTNPLMDMWGYTLLALGAGALIVLVTKGPAQGIVRVVFRNPILRFHGRYSYAMYLLHIPMIFLLTREFRALGLKGDGVWFAFVGLSFGLTIVSALLTWHLLEKHAFALKRYFEYQSTKNEA